MEDKTKMVFLNIEESNYILEKDGLRFYFSSEFNKNRFKFRVDDYILEETLKLHNKYKIKANYSLILLLSFYRKIEKRGWRVEFDDGKILNENSIIFATNY